MTVDPPAILFVDDEPGILKALRRLFMDEDWQILLAESGEEGLSILREKRIDLVVSDVRMPGMDGIEFLSQVKQSHPEVARILLSGYAEKESVAQALAHGCAQQILPKPWDDRELRDVLKNALTQSRERRQEKTELRTVINSLSSLPPLPAIYQELRNCLADRDNFTIDQVVQIIRQDIALSTNLLHWANSALFGQRRRVDTIKRAVMLLGVDIVESLILSDAVARALDTLTTQAEGFNSLELQQHAMSCAILARLLVLPHAQQQPELADRAFIAGLLHDIGLLAEAGLFHQQFARIAILAEQKLPLVEAEREVLQISHPEVGAALAEWWSLPEFLVNSIRWHHEPLLAPADAQLTAVVATADILATQFGHGISCEQWRPVFTDELFSRQGLTDDRIEQLRLSLEENFNNGVTDEHTGTQ